jgi:tripartite-type tricarboxylate transporter receptor subunit TctC
MDSRRTFPIFLIFAVLIVTFSVAFAAEKDYPDHQVEIIVTYPPGGPLDTAARIIHPPLQTALGQSIILTTKGGVGGALGTESVARAKPDGYTLGVIANSSVTSGPIINPSLPYKHTDLIPVCLLVTDPEAIISKTDAPWKTLDEMVSYAKKNPGKLTYGTPGFGSVAYFEMEVFKLAYGLDIEPVHFQGSAPAMTAVLGGHVDLGIGGLFASIPQIKAGKIKLLATSAEKRVAAFPDIPTLSEKGIKEAVNIWIGLYAPAKCPKMVVERLSREMEKIMKSQATISQFEKAGLAMDYRDSAATSKLIEEEITAILKVVKKVGIGKQ